jgi:hypothetical protein
MNVEQKIVVQKHETRRVRVSDFSGVEIPEFHWQTITRISCTEVDGCGNKYPVFNLDLMPEEMAAFQREVRAILQRHLDASKAKAVKP